jgi:hypothetical protein
MTKKSESFFVVDTTPQRTTTTHAVQHKKHQHHDLPLPLASSGFNYLGECNCSTSRGQSQSAQHGNAIFLFESNEFSILFTIIL